LSIELSSASFPTIGGMPVDIDIAKVARLARIGLSPEELDHYGKQLQGILEHAARVQALPTAGVTPTAHPLPMVNAFRPDDVEPTLDREEVLSQAPDRDGSYFRVPPYLED
jgi:aspartyl-tRNA(Asn)/glutamyl-tRNA(Gln) amidotransferase subunit C